MPFGSFRKTSEPGINTEPESVDPTEKPGDPSSI